MFLQHLHHSSILHSPPFLPKPFILKSLTSSTPITLNFPRRPALLAEDLLAADDLDDYTEHSALHWARSVLSLFHYFDCQQAMERCEEMILIPCRESGPAGLHYWLPYAEQYGLAKVDAVCLEGVGSDQSAHRRRR